MKKSSNFRERFLRRRGVVMAVLSGGHPDAVAKEFGVSRATVYNWVGEHRVSGVKQLTHADGDKRFALPGLTPFVTLNFIRRCVVSNPEMSADNLSGYLGTMGQDVQPRTLRNIFSELGVSNARERQRKAFEWRRGQFDEQEISDDQMTEIVSELDKLAIDEPRGRQPGDVMVQDRIKFPKRFCQEPLALELIVDTFAPMKRIYATVGTPTDRLSVVALDKVQAAYVVQESKTHTFLTPRKRQYAGDLGAVAYPNWFDKHLQQVLKVRQPNSKTADSRINGAWTLLKSEWLKPMSRRLPVNGFKRQQIDDALQEWLESHRKKTVIHQRR